MNLFPARVADAGQVAVGSETRPISLPSTGHAAVGADVTLGARPEHIDVVDEAAGRSRHHPRPCRAARWRNLSLRIGSRPAAAHRAPGRAGGVRAATSGSACASSARRFTFSMRTEARSASADIAEEIFRMKALTEGRYRGRDGIWAVFDLGWRHGAARRHPRARYRPGRHEARRGLSPRSRLEHRAGRARAPLSKADCATPRTGFTCPEAVGGAARRHGRARSRRLDRRRHIVPLRHRLASRRGKPSLPAGPADAGLFPCPARPARFSTSWRGDEKERHYGVGDKAGPLDHTGRRFKIDAVDPCGFDAELSDPLYKMIPFVIVDGPAGAHGVFYDNLAVGEMDLGCTHRQLSRPVSLLQRAGRRSRFLCPCRTRRAGCGAPLLLADRRSGLRAEMVPRLRHDLDDDRGRAGCRCEDHGLHREVPSSPHPLRQLPFRFRLHAPSARAATRSTGTATSSPIPPPPWRA